MLHRNLILWAFALLFSLQVYGQRTDIEVARDTIVPWSQLGASFKPRVNKNATVDGLFHSSKQLDFVDSLHKWVELSYIPRAEAIEVLKSPKTGYHNEGSWSSPIQTYGISALHFPCNYFSYNKTLECGGETWGGLVIGANKTIGDPIRDFELEGTYFFSMEEPPGNKSAKSVDQLNLYNKIHPALYKFPVWEEDYEYHILIAKDFQNPFVPLTVKQYLDVVERYVRLNPGKVDGGKILAEVESNRVKFAAQMDEIARFQSTNMLDLTNLSMGTTGWDNEYLIYPISKERIDRTKLDKPEWLVFTIKGEGFYEKNDPRDGRSVTSQYLFESIITNFDFDHLYNFTFYPEKLNGKAYKPKQVPLTQLPPKSYVTPRSITAQNALSDSTILFYEDFSGNEIYKEPLGWFSLGQRSYTPNYSCRVVVPEGKKSPWLRLWKEEVMSPTAFKEVLPENFTISFNLFANKDYTWGSSACSFMLTDMNDYETFLMTNFNLEDFAVNERIKSKNSIHLELRPADYNNYDLQLKVYPPPQEFNYNEKGKFYVIEKYNTSKGQTDAFVELTVEGTRLKISINGELILDEPQILPKGIKFSNMGWGLFAMINEKDNFYLSNITIRKN